VPAKKAGPAACCASYGFCQQIKLILGDDCDKPGHSEPLEVQVIEHALDLTNPSSAPSNLACGALQVSLEWIPLNPGTIPRPPSSAFDSLLQQLRGDLFVRIVRARNLPPADTDAVTSNACVHLNSTGQFCSSRCEQSLAPVWLEAFRLHCLGPASTVAVAVRHVHKSTLAGELFGQGPTIVCPILFLPRIIYLESCVWFLPAPLLRAF
jgi:hypothetical protein